MTSIHSISFIYVSDRSESIRECAKIVKKLPQVNAARHDNALQVIRMRMKLIFTIAAILGVGCIWWGSNVSYAGQLSLHEWGQIMGPDLFACRSHDDWKKMTALMPGDATAAKEFGQKNCKLFEDMTLVRVENSSNDALCVRPMGGYDCFWILPQWVHGLDDN